MATLVFDIETVGTNWTDLTETTKASLTKWIERTSKTPEESDRYIGQVKDGLGLSPLTGSIVSLAMWDIERKRGVVYVVGSPPVIEQSEQPEGEEEKVSPETKQTEQGFTIRYCTERDLLEDFWEGARSYDIFVSFNGRRFDVPFLLHRSVACEVKPTVELARNQYLKLQTYPYHVDLQDELTFYGSMYRRPSLHLFCQTYGIDSPKEHVDGDAVATLVAEQKYTQLANYNAADVVATTELFAKWKEYLAPASFLNTVEF